MPRKVVPAIVTEPDGTERYIAPVGRDGQTLEAAVKAEAKGFTALDLAHWAVRLSHYVYKLRKVYGLHIDMVEEPHGGEYPGKHGRYFLRSQVRLVESTEREAA